ncbi:hypothetical protein DNTS_029016 [Danionella cerebrum]|uniref:Uncharacterized protein n=1 Tax=Danionella cerebrum TaxID=2873325 RepID=A0A553Q9X9_9TELE|nr:hypothetical protein DNTS_029016 [Danionella translucida]
MFILDCWHHRLHSVTKLIEATAHRSEGAEAVWRLSVSCGEIPVGMMPELNQGWPEMSSSSHLLSGSLCRREQRSLQHSVQSNKRNVRLMKHI